MKEIIKLQANNIINIIDSMINDKNVKYTTLEFGCSQKSDKMELVLTKKKDTVETSNYLMNLPNNCDNRFYEELLNEIINNYFLHNEIEITFITAEYDKDNKNRGRLDIFKLGEEKSVRIYINGFSNIYEFKNIINNYNEKISARLKKQESKQK